MARVRRIGPVVGIALLAGVLSLRPAQAAERLADRVFVVSVETCSPEMLADCAVPNIRNLGAHGSWTWDAVSTSPLRGLPTAASMVSGLYPRRHGVDWDRWEQTRVGLESDSIFTITSRLGGRPAAFLGRQKLLHLVRPELRGDSWVLGPRDSDVMDAAIQDVFSESRMLWFLDLAESDEAALRYGWGSAEHYAALENADVQIGRLLDAIRSREWSTSSAMIVTSDRGGSTAAMTEGQASRIPWVVCGPRIRAGYEITNRLRVIDTAATAMAILGLEAPTDWDGRPPLRVLGEN